MDGSLEICFCVSIHLLDPATITRSLVERLRKKAVPTYQPTSWLFKGSRQTGRPAARQAERSGRAESS